MRTRKLLFGALLTVALAVCSAVVALAAVSPPSVEVTLNPGESYTVEKTVDVPAVPPIVDVVFAVDLTGSMGGELNQVKTHLTNTLNALAALPGVDLQVAIVSHEDYPASYNSCGYNATYGSTYKPDSPFRLDQSMTSSFAAAQAAANAMTLGSGADGPESYTRVMWESAQADSGIGYRAGAFKLQVFFLDNVPHDCDLNQGVPGAIGTWTTGVDPGRNAAVDCYLGGGVGCDDIDLQDDAIADMVANNVRQITMYSGSGNLNYWQYWSGLTGGSAVQLDYNGNPPAGVSLVEVITGEVKKAAAAPVVITPVAVGCAPLVVSFSPASVGPVAPPTTVSFQETIAVPLGTPGGDYTCTVEFRADGSVIGTQDITIHVPMPATATPTATPTPMPTATPAPSEGRMTGGGRIAMGQGKAALRVNHGFTLHCDVSEWPNNLQVNWDKGNKFHLESLDSAFCSDDPSIDEAPPVTGFDTYVGSGTGRLNGVSGATINFMFTDAGEPGRNDTAEITIFAPDSTVVLSVSGNLNGGNHQAHENNQEQR